MLSMMALRNVRRNVRRTILTMATVTLGCCLLIVALSWLSGIHGNLVNSFLQASGKLRITSQAYVDKEALFPIEENLPLTAPVVEMLKKVDGISHIYPKITQGVAASIGGQEIGEVFGLLIGAPIDYYQQILELDQKIKKGGQFFSKDPKKAEKESLLGQALARDMEISVGGEAIFLGQTQDGSIAPIKTKVVGIVETGNNVFDRQAYVHIARARWMADIPEGATEIIIYSDLSAANLARRIKPMLSELSTQSQAQDVNGKPATLIAQQWKEREPIGSIIKIAYVIHFILGSVIVFITALGVLNTMMMSVLERTTELGILRALGMPRHHIAALFVFEAMVIAFLGGLIGVVLGSGLSIMMESYGIDLGSSAANISDALPISTTIHPDWTISIAMVALGLAMLMAILGSALPAWQALRISPVNAMRNKG